MLHDYHLYARRGSFARRGPDVFLHHFIHIPWTQPDAWRVLPRDIREDIYYGRAGQRHRRVPHALLQAQLPALLPRAVRPRGRRGGGRRGFEDREIWVRAYPLPISAETFLRTAQRAEVHEYEREILRRRRDHLILRVDRADLSKNVLRGFTAFDLFLEQHPEFLEKVTFIAHLMPSRQDVPEYAEYLEKIEALVAVVNHRHGTPDWMPIDLRLRENLDEAIAEYKHYDLLIVNAMFDGMNLVAKEGPLVNERHGVSLLSREHGRARGARRVRALGQPVRHPGAGRRHPRALTMSTSERSRRAEGLKQIVHRAGPRRLDRRPAGRHRGQEAGRRAAADRSRLKPFDIPAGIRHTFRYVTASTPSLPPGPRLPRPLQTLGWAVRACPSCEALPGPLRRHVHRAHRPGGHLGDAHRPRRRQAGLHGRPASCSTPARPTRSCCPLLGHNSVLLLDEDDAHAPAQADAAALPRRADAALRRADGARSPSGRSTPGRAASRSRCGRACRRSRSR